MNSSRPPNVRPVSDDPLIASAVANTPALLSLIFGVVSCIPAVGLLFTIPTIILGHIGMLRAHRLPATHNGRPLAIAGLMLGYLILLLYLWMLVGLVIVPRLSGR
ncbi:MAG: DUF4190 domain-containing protein [Ktedonobacterales bacterium]